MKRNFLYKVMFLAMIAVVSMTFTACGGDSDDDGTPQVPTGPTGSTEYVDPCLDFGSLQSHVKEYMSGFNWELNENSNEYTLLYTNQAATVVINYMFIGNGKGLGMVGVTYASGGDSKALGFKAEIEKRYGITMKKVTNSEDGTEYIYEGLATIGGKQVEIMMNCYKQGINIIYALPD